MNKLMDGKAGLVTGAGSGIGQATAVAFAKEGAKVVVSDINEEAGSETIRLIEEAGGEAIFFNCDVSDEEQVKALVDKTVSTYGQLDFAHNNAGYNGKFAPLGEIESDIWDWMMKINLYGTFYCMKHEINAMLETGGGSIVNTSSGAGLIGIPNNAPYNAVKFGIVGMTRNTAMDYGSKGIRVNALAPGSTMTPMMKNAFEQNPGPEFVESVTGNIPMGKLAEPEDQANAVVWLCSEQARMITGVTLPVDGGFVAGK